MRVVTGAAEQRAVTEETGWLLLEKRLNKLKANICWGIDDAEIEGRTWRGWHQHVTMVLLACAFLATLRGTGRKNDLPTIPIVARALVIEKETQTLVAEDGCHKTRRSRSLNYLTICQEADRLVNRPGNVSPEELQGCGRRPRRSTREQGLRARGPR